MTYEKDIKLSSEIFFRISGAMDANLELMEKRFGVRIHATSEGIKISGNEQHGVEECAELISALSALARQGQTVDRVVVERCADMIERVDA